MLIHGQGLNGAPVSHESAVHAHVDRELASAKLQEGAQATAVLVHVDGQSDKGPTGPMFWHDPAVLAGVDRQFGAAKLQEGGA